MTGLRPAELLEQSSVTKILVAEIKILNDHDVACFFLQKNGFLLLSKFQRTQCLPKIAKGTTLPGKAHIDIHISINVNSHSSVTEETEGLPFKKGLQRSERQEKKLKVRRG